ncbi:VOC family protein [Arthrobacter crystallopoietes]|uniref:VOC family protein n=1 Tax=Crystallibacter crystallopoietes TaxID=37928 RepID=UPI001ABE82E8|nr:VOC family protein [Arthrobacter crystallopoietes]QTG82211.1 VOC family protein [Arthrobacter crystallopoietes]
MITSVHTLIYSDDPTATRAFLRDVLQWPAVPDAGSGEDWLIFKTGPSELGVHPTRGVWEGEEFSAPRHHQIALMCDDLAATRSELESRGAGFSSESTDMGFGTGAMLQVPGADDILLYQPSHASAFNL